MDSILFWSGVAGDCNRTDFTTPKGAKKPSPANGGPTRSSRAMAMAHIAMHDAWFGVSGFGGLPGGTPKNLYLLVAPPAYAGVVDDDHAASAVAGAASTMLTLLFPAEGAAISAKMKEICAVRGHFPDAADYGRRVALLVWDLRARDHGDNSADAGYAGSNQPHRHRPDPASPGQGFHGTAYGLCRPFVLGNVAPIDPYPAPSTAAYKNAFKEVYEKGGAATRNTTTRKPDETAIGLFWAYDGAEKIGTPPRLYNQILTTIALSQGNSEHHNARLFGLANAAMGDCAIYAWREKYVWDLWRPVVGIRENDVTSTGPAVMAPNVDKRVTAPCDPFWLPLGRPSSNVSGDMGHTPDFPAYPSGHATFGSAVFEIVRQFYKEVKPATNTFSATQEDAIGFTFTSDELNGATLDPDGSLRTRQPRKYSSVAEAMYDNVVSRVYLGVHWRFDGTSGHSVAEMLQATDRIGGVPLGRDIGAQVFAGFVQQ